MKSLMILALLSSAAFAQQAPLVTVTGNLDPKFSIEVKPDEMKAVADGLKNLTNLTPQKIDINDLMREGDVPAFQKAAQRISDMFVESAKTLIDMRVLIYRLSALTNQNAGTQGYGGQLTSAYETKFKDDYSHLVSTFNQIDQDLLAATLACKSELCTIQITNAHIELIEFSKQIAGGIDLRKKKMFGESAQIQNPIVKTSLGATFEQLKAKDGTYPVMLASALSPFIASSSDASAFSQKVGSVMSGEQTNLSYPPLHAGKIHTHARMLVKALHSVSKEKIFSVVNNIAMGSPDMETLMGRNRLRFVTVFACGSSLGTSSHNLDYAGALFEYTGMPDYIMDGQTMDRNCIDLFNGKDYKFTRIGSGPGIGGILDVGIYILFSPIPIRAQEIGGNWYGVGAHAGLGASLSTGLYFGQNGSMLIPVHVGAGIGGFVTFDQISIERGL